MPLHVRAARPSDIAAAELLYLSAAPYYDRFAGSPGRARRVLAAVFPREAHTASWSVCRVAERDGRVVGVMAAFPASAGDALARRFLVLSTSRMPPWRWPGVVRHLRASMTMTPAPPRDTLYVDALAVAGEARRSGVATALLAAADELAAAVGARAVALDTGLENAPAQALYAALGFRRTHEQTAADARIARIVGGRGFVSFERPLR